MQKPYCHTARKYWQHLVATQSENHRSNDAPKTFEAENPCKNHIATQHESISNIPVATQSENLRRKDAPKTIESENPCNILVADHYDLLGYSTSEKNCDKQVLYSKEIGELLNKTNEA
jgi:hypothetical protein